MEKYFVPIFKFSCMVRILPYLGYLHQWRNIMQKLCTKTKEVWEDSEQMFERAGKDCKATVKFGLYSKKQFDKLGARRSVVPYFDYTFTTTYIDIELNNVIEFAELIPKDHIMSLNYKNLFINEYYISLEEKNEDAFDRNNYTILERNSTLKTYSFSSSLLKIKEIIKNKQSVLIYKENDDILMYSSKENQDLFVQEKLNSWELLLDNYKKESFEIQDENKNKMESSSRMFISTNSPEIIKSYATNIINCKCPIKEIYYKKTFQKNDTTCMMLMLNVLPKAIFSMQNDPIDFTKVDKTLGFERMRLSADSGIATAIIKFDSFDENPNNQNCLLMRNPKIIDVRDAKLISTITGKKEYLLSTLLTQIENSLFSFLDIQISVNKIKTFENPYLYQIKNLSTLCNLNYSRFLIKDDYCSSMGTKEFQNTLKKLSSANALDISMMDKGFQKLLSETDTLYSLVCLKIRRISFIQIEVDDEDEYFDFLNIIKLSQRLEEVCYSYQRFSSEKPELRGRLKGIKTTNYTGRKAKKIHRSRFLI